MRHNRAPARRRWRTRRAAFAGVAVTNRGCVMKVLRFHGLVFSLSYQLPCLFRRHTSMSGHQNLSSLQLMSRDRTTERASSNDMNRNKASGFRWVRRKLSVASVIRPFLLCQQNEILPHSSTCVNHCSPSIHGREASNTNNTITPKSKSLPCFLSLNSALISSLCSRCSVISLFSSSIRYSAALFLLELNGECRSGENIDVGDQNSLKQRENEPEDGTHWNQNLGAEIWQNHHGLTDGLTMQGEVSSAGKSISPGTTT